MTWGRSSLARPWSGRRGRRTHGSPRHLSGSGCVPGSPSTAARRGPSDDRRRRRVAETEGGLIMGRPSKGGRRKSVWNVGETARSLDQLLGDEKDPEPCASGRRRRGSVGGTAPSAARG